MAAVDPTIVVETAEAVAEVAAPAVMATGCLDYKKVAIVTGTCMVVAVGTYFTVKAIKKRKEEKELLESAVEVNPEELVEDEVEENVIVIEEKKGKK